MQKIVEKKGYEQRKYSAQFKISVIMDMRENHLGYRETVRKYWKNSKGKEANYKNTVKRWERIYLEEGAEGLMKERRGGANKKKSQLSEIEQKPLEEKTKEELIEENRWLRMENDYLKKLRALVLAEEQEKGKKQ